MNEPPVTPTRIHAPHGASFTEITWSDGKRHRYPNAFLRGWCPCAGCQGHGAALRFRSGHNSELRDLVPAGSYALRLVWGDGHDAGLYTYRYLRELAARPEVTQLEDAGATGG